MLTVRSSSSSNPRGCPQSGWARVAWRSGVGTLALAGACSIIQPAAAQVAAPTRDDLGVIRPEAPARRQSRFTVDGDIERGPCPLANPAYANLTVNFARVRFTGLTAVDPAVLADTWQSEAGHDQPLSSLCAVRDRAAARLREMGYLAAVQVPPQRIDKGGEVAMDVIVAKLIDVQVRGDAGHAENLIAAHVRQLAGREWFNLRDAERHLLLLGDLPGFDVRLTLRPAGRAPGEVVGDLLVTRRPVEMVAGIQNFAGKATGREGLFAQLAFNDLFGLGDRTAFSFYNTAQTREQTVLGVNESLALGSDGLRLEAALTWGRSRPRLAAGIFRTRTLVGKLGLTYPFIRREAASLHGSTGIEMANQSIDFGSSPVSRDRLRIAYAGLDFEALDAASIAGRGGYNAIEPRWRVAGSLEARQGLSGLGASSDCTPVTQCLPPHVPISNFFADPSAFVLRMEGNVEVRPTPVVTVAFAPRAQVANHPLLSFEQFTLGNYTVGRGFDPGAVLGDSGVGGSLELRLGSLVPKGRRALALQPYAFFDAGWAWSKDKTVTIDPYRLTSAGGGLRARWGDRIDANLIVAAPLEKLPGETRRRDVRVLFNIVARILPWGTP